MQQQLNVSQLFELIGRQTVEIQMLRDQLAQRDQLLRARAAANGKHPGQESSPEPVYSE